MKDLVVLKALTSVSRFLHLEQFTVIKNSLNKLDQLPAMHFDEHHIFPKAENEKSYNWSILAYSVFWTERLAGRSPFQQQVISVATDTPLNHFHCISESNYLDSCSDLWYTIFHANQAFSFQIKISWGSQLQPATSRHLIFSAHQCIPPSSLAFTIFICISSFLIIFHCFWSFIFIHRCNFY